MIHDPTRGQFNGRDASGGTRMEPPENAPTLAAPAMIHDPRRDNGDIARVNAGPLAVPQLELAFSQKPDF
jgi:hypothetical protein